MAKAKVGEKLSQALSKREQAVKALENERADRASIEEVIQNEAFKQAKQKAMADIVTFGIGFKRLALFMIEKMYLELDFSNVDLTKMEGHDVSDPVDGLVTLVG